MAQLSPGGFYPAPVVVLPGRRRIYGRRRLYSRDALENEPIGATEFEANEEFENAEGDMYDVDGDELGDFVEDDEEQMQDELSTGSELPSRESLIKEISDNPLSQKELDMVKVHCDSCNGHTLLQDGEVAEMKHLANCSVLASGGKNVVAPIGCKKEKNTCKKPERVIRVHAYPAPPEPVCPKKVEDPCADEEEELSCSDEESSCSDDEEDEQECPAPPVCKKPVEEKSCPKEDKGETIEVYVESEAKLNLASQLREAHDNNKPISASFQRTVLSSDGKSQMQVQVGIKTSKRNAEGKSALEVSLTPMKDGKAIKNSNINAVLWHVDHNQKTDKRFQFQGDGAKSFVDAGVHKEVLLDAVGFIESAMKFKN